jgi:hypothetical protein
MKRIDQRSPLYFWLTVAFAVLYGAMAWGKAFRADYLVQDDARFYLYWMARLIDPTALPQDLMADYAQAVTPIGFTALYGVFAHWGISPLLLSKLLPFALGLVSAMAMYAVTMAIAPIRLTAFLSSLLLNQSLWFRDDLASATPRAFIYPCLLFFLYGLLRQRFWILGSAIGLQSLFYPPFTLVCLCLLAVFVWQRWRSRLLRREWVWRSLGVALIGIASLLPYVFASQPFGPVVSLAEGLQMLEFGEKGRLAYFFGSAWQFLGFGEHSGVIPGLMPPLIWLAVLLPFLGQQGRAQFQAASGLLLNLLVVSLGLWGMAHVVWLRLYFPSRYVNHTLRIAAAIAAAIVLTMLIEKTWQLWQDRDRRRSLWVGLSGVLLTLCISYPHLSDFPKTNYRISSEPALFQRLQNSPKDTMVATLSEVANAIPVFTQRSVLFSREMANPYHLGYYRQIRQRIADTLRAQYHADPKEFLGVVQRYGIRYWLIEANAWEAGYLTDKSKQWLSSIEPEYSQSLSQGRSSWLRQQSPFCQVWQSDRLSLLDTTCLIDRGSKN